MGAGRARFCYGMQPAACAEADERPPGPQVEITSIELQPDAECAYEEGFGVAIGWNSDTPLYHACWRFRYMVDTSKKRKYIDLGATDAAHYGVGHNGMAFSLPRFDLASSGIPADMLRAQDGLLSAVLTGSDAAGQVAEVFTVNFVVKMWSNEHGLRRFIFNPMA